MMGAGMVVRNVAFEPVPGFCGCTPIVGVLGVVRNADVRGDGFRKR